MKNLLMTTALVLATATSAMAAGHEMKPMMSMEGAVEGDIKASKLIGMRIYATENAMTLKAPQTERDWDDIGEVNDVILNMDGSVRAVILGIGGFLGIGEKNVAVTIDSLHIVPEADDADDFFLVVNANKNGLAEMVGYVDDDADAMGSDTTNMSNTLTRKMLNTPDVKRDGYTVAKMEELTTEDLTGARVYGPNDEDIGEVDRLVMSSDGASIATAVLDIGGFLGMGEHTVGVTLDELRILREDDGDDVRVYVDSNMEALKAQPEYK